MHDGGAGNPPVAELRDASHLWGTLRVTGEAERAIKQELGDDKIQVAQIGPGGEKLVRFAAIMNMSNRAHGRTGMGAVMGSKNLKAIAVRGHGRVSVADQEAVTRLARLASTRLPDYPDMKGLQDYGTASVLNYQNSVGGLPTRNYASGVFEQADNLSGERMADTILKENDTCYACAVRCKRVVETEYKGVTGRPVLRRPGVRDAGHVWLVLRHWRPVRRGIGEPDVRPVRRGHDHLWRDDCLCDGVLSRKASSRCKTPAASTCALAMPTPCWRCSTRSCAARVWATCWRTARRTPHDKIGRGAEDLVVAVKNQELPAHMPQVKRSLALIYAVNPFGADHQSS